MFRLSIFISLLLLAIANQATASWFSKLFGYPDVTEGPSTKDPPILTPPAHSINANDEKLKSPALKGTTFKRYPNATTNPMKHNFDNYQIKRIKENVERLGSMSEAIFLGDSVFYRICRNKTRWSHLEKKYAAINLGSPGDRTEHLLHRFSDGRILSNITSTSPLVVAMIGASNALLGDTPSSIIDGVSATILLLNTHLRSPKIVLLSLLPRYTRPTADIISATNALLEAQYNSSQSIIYVDVAKIFLFANDTINFAMYSPDRITPNAAGQVRELQRTNPPSLFVEGLTQSLLDIFVVDSGSDHGSTGTLHVRPPSAGKCSTTSRCAGENFMKLPCRQYHNTIADLAS